MNRMNFKEPDGQIQHRFGDRRKEERRQVVMAVAVERRSKGDRRSGQDRRRGWLAL